MNLLMIAPLYDNKGAVRYFIGAQVDINGLIEGGRGIDSFERLLAQDRHQARYGEAAMSKTPQAALGELSNMLNDDDMEIVRHSGREMTARRPSGASTPVTQAQRQTGRRYVGMDNPEDRNLWPAPSLGPSGRLPGVFQNVSGELLLSMSRLTFDSISSSDHTPHFVSPSPLQLSAFLASCNHASSTASVEHHTFVRVSSAQ